MKTSLAALLVRDIETFAERLRTTHPLLEAAQTGELSAETVAAYLMNVRFMVSHTPRHLGAAAKRCRELGRGDLAEFYGAKLVEEAGHEQWADSDLSRLGQVFGVRPPSEPSRQLLDLTHYLDRVIRDAPALYLAYTLFVEYSMLLLGPIWLQALRDGCNIPADALTVVSKHVELDLEHVADELREIDRLSRGDDPSSYQDVLHDSMRSFELFCDELLRCNDGLRTSSIVAAE